MCLPHIRHVITTHTYLIIVRVLHVSITMASVVENSLRVSRVLSWPYRSTLREGLHTLCVVVSQKRRLWLVAAFQHQQYTHYSILQS